METQSRFVKAKELPAQYGISPAYGYKLERQGRFPKRVNLNPDPKGKSVTRWLRADLDQWLEDRLNPA